MYQFECRSHDTGGGRNLNWTVCVFATSNQQDGHDDKEKQHTNRKGYRANILAGSMADRSAMDLAARFQPPLPSAPSATRTSVAVPVDKREHHRANERQGRPFETISAARGTAGHIRSFRVATAVQTCRSEVARASLPTLRHYQHYPRQRLQCDHEIEAASALGRSAELVAPDS